MIQGLSRFTCSHTPCNPFQMLVLRRGTDSEGESAGKSAHLPADEWGDTYDEAATLGYGSPQIAASLPTQVLPHHIPATTLLPATNPLHHYSIKLVPTSSFYFLPFTASNAFHTFSTIQSF